MKRVVPIVESAALRQELQAELRLPEADERLPVGIDSPAIIMRRHERASPFDDSYGFPKATYVDGYDEAGNLITTKSLLERQSIVGRAWQSVVERWKIARVRAILNRSEGLIPPIHHP